MSRNTPIKAHYATNTHKRYPKAGIGAWQTLLRTPLVNNGRLLKDIAGGRGLMNTVWPRNFEEEEPQLEDKSENDLKMSHARPGRPPARWNLADRACYN